MGLRDQLIELEGSFWNSVGDPDFFRRHMADDGVMAFDVGLMTKDDIVAVMHDNIGWAGFTIDDARFVQVAEDVASLTYTTVAVPAGSTDEYRAAVTSVYARRDGEWLMVLHQHTVLAG